MSSQSSRRTPRSTSAAGFRYVTDGVLLRMLAEESLRDVSIYFDESHQMSSQLSVHVTRKAGAREKFQKSRPHNERDHRSGRVHDFSGHKEPLLGFGTPVSCFHRSGTCERLGRNAGPVVTVSFIRSRQTSRGLVFLPTRRLVERYAGSQAACDISRRTRRNLR